MRKNISWKTEKLCDLQPTKVELKGILEKFKIKKILWSKTRDNSNIIIEEPVSKN